MNDAPDESSISAALRGQLDGLGDRCIWREEVWMLCWTHSLRRQADRLRIDYVAELDGRLIGIETKAPPEHAVDIGRYLLQCAQYASGIVAPNRQEVPQRWIGKPLAGVFLRTKLYRKDEWIMEHLRAAPRLYGPANVGFLTREKRGLCLRLSGERFWTEWRGWHQGMLNKASRVGNGSFQTED